MTKLFVHCIHENASFGTHTHTSAIQQRAHRIHTQQGAYYISPRISYISSRGGGAARTPGETRVHNARLPSYSRVITHDTCQGDKRRTHTHTTRNLYWERSHFTYNIRMYILIGECDTSFTRRLGKRYGIYIYIIARLNSLSSCLLLTPHNILVCVGHSAAYSIWLSRPSSD